LILGLLVLSYRVVAASDEKLQASPPKPTKDEVELSLKLREFELKRREHWLTVFGSTGTALALFLGFWQYVKAEKWKRAEFLAREMKEFFSDVTIQNVLTMIDWSPRRVNLFLSTDPDRQKYPLVTRPLQVTALLPHTFLTKDRGSDAESSSGGSDDAIEAVNWKDKMKYSSREARIRDSYDRFFDGLERFGGYVKSGLLSRKELDPYLRYWIEDIAVFTTNKDDAAWTCLVFAYIEIYGFAGVQFLFQKYGCDISTSKDHFKNQAAEMKDKELAKRLIEECARKRAPGGNSTDVA